MCIIALYKKGVKPDKATLEHMIKGNPDGVGVAWNDGRVVHYRKGLTTASQVLHIYHKVRRKAETFVFHARIATSGGVSAQKCHPYPLALDEGALNATRYDGLTPVAFHNGVLPLTPAEGLNDTQTFIRDSLAPLHDIAPRSLKDGVFDDIIELATRGSRFVILYPDDFTLYGNWQEADGVLYSNGNYKPFTSYYTTTRRAGDLCGYSYPYDWKRWNGYEDLE